MRRLRILSLSGFIAIIPWTANAQQSRELETKNLVRVANQSAAVMVGPFDCDSDSNAFFMPPAGKGLPDTVVRISADGKKTTRFELHSAPEFDKSQVLGYSVGLDDDVYVLASKDGHDTNIVRFDKDGKFQSAIQLDLKPGTIPRRIAVISATNYFIGGSQQEGDNLIRKEFEGIFDGQGKMTSPVQMQVVPYVKGIDSLRVSDIPHLDPDQAAQAQQSQQRLDLSIVKAGADGNYYFAPFDLNGPVFVVSSSGEVLKKINVAGPTEGEYELLDFKVSNRRLMLAYEGQPPSGGTAPVKIHIYDIDTGKKIAEFHHENWRIGTALACYSQGTFTFISSDESGIMQIVTASAK